jgi:hypothetical protein
MAANDAAREIVAASDVIEDLAAQRIEEEPVDSEVAAGGVLALVGEGDPRRAAGGRCSRDRAEKWLLRPASVRPA